MCERADVLICGQHSPGRPAQMELLVFGIDAVQAESIYGPVQHPTHSCSRCETVSLVDSVEVHCNRDFAAAMNVDVMLMLNAAFVQPMFVVQLGITVFNKECRLEVFGKTQFLRFGDDVVNGRVFGNVNDFLLGGSHAMEIQLNMLTHYLFKAAGCCARHSNEARLLNLSSTAKHMLELQAPLDRKEQRAHSGPETTSNERRRIFPHKRWARA